MFVILPDKTIGLTRGDVANIEVSANLQDGQKYSFKKGDVVRFSVIKKRDCRSIVLQKDVVVAEETETITVCLASEDTKIGELPNRPVEYWYEVELNPDTEPQTIIGYDEAGEKIFRLYPEGGKVE